MTHKMEIRTRATREVSLIVLKKLKTILRISRRYFKYLYSACTALMYYSKKFLTLGMLALHIMKELMLPQLLLSNRYLSEIRSFQRTHLFKIITFIQLSLRRKINWICYPKCWGYLKLNKRKVV